MVGWDRGGTCLQGNRPQCKDGRRVSWATHDGILNKTVNLSDLQCDNSSVITPPGVYRLRGGGQEEEEERAKGRRKQRPAARRTALGRHGSMGEKGRGGVSPGSLERARRARVLLAA